MKININNNLYIQEIDIDAVHSIHVGLPRYVSDEITSELGLFHEKKEDRFLHCFKDPRTISFFNGFNYLLDYDSIKCLNEEELNNVLKYYNEEIEELEEEEFYALIKRKPYNAKKAKYTKAKQYFYNELKNYKKNKEQIDIEFSKLLNNSENEKKLIKEKNIN